MLAKEAAGEPLDAAEQRIRDEWAANGARRHQRAQVRGRGGEAHLENAVGETARASLGRGERREGFLCRRLLQYYLSC